MTPGLVDRVLARLDVGGIRADHAGLIALYGAWCERVPFDNVRKLVHLGEGRSAPLPGSSSTDFFDAWLATGAGGTCWAGNGALYELCRALGFAAERVLATMLTRPDQPPNHGSVLVYLEGERFIVDASILSGTPLLLSPSVGLPRIELANGTYTIVWRTPRAPEGFPCRIDRIGITDAEHDAFHQATATWGPFNYAVSARVNRNGLAIAYYGGQRFAFQPDGSVASGPIDRNRFLVDEMHIAAELVARVPPDRELPPAP
jgi:N-hydroxyarylamine O-acetyltransferase